jgi:hypothetical protein
MPIRQMAIAAALAAGLAAVPVSATQAQYYPPCSPFPLFWPFCAAGAVVGTAATIVTAPFWALTGTPPYYYGYYGQPYFPPSAYNAPRSYPPPAPAYPQPYTSADLHASDGPVRRQHRQAIEQRGAEPLGGSACQSTAASILSTTALLKDVGALAA